MNDSLLKSLKTSRCGKGIEPYSLRLEIFPVTKKNSVYLHERHVAEFLVVSCEQDIFEWKDKAERRLKNEPGTDHLPFLTMVSTAWAI